MFDGKPVQEVCPEEEQDHIEQREGLRPGLLRKPVLWNNKEIQSSCTLPSHACCDIGRQQKYTGVQIHTIKLAPTLYKVHITIQSYPAHYCMCKKGSSSPNIGIYEHVPYSKQATHLTNHCLQDTTVIAASADLLRTLGGLVQPWGGGTTTCRSHQWYLVGSSGSIPEDTHPSLHWQYTPCCSPLLHCKSSCCRWELPHEPGGSMQYCL